MDTHYLAPWCVYPGYHLLHFRRLGVAPLTITVDVKPNVITNADVRMGVLAQTLAAVVVQTSRGEIFHIPNDLAQRMKTGLGHYLTYEDIERRRATRTSDLFTGIAGLEVDRFGRVGNTRGITTLNSKASMTGCGMGLTTYLDGFPVGVAGSLTAGSLDVVRPSDIMAIEVYNGPAEMPATLPPSPCGAVFIWTKR